MLKTAYLVFYHRWGKEPTVLKATTWAEVLDHVSEASDCAVVAYNQVSEVRSYFDEEGTLILQK
jgi:hypothetical protein